MIGSAEQGEATSNTSGAILSIQNEAKVDAKSKLLDWNDEYRNIALWLCCNDEFLSAQGSAQILHSSDQKSRNFETLDRALRFLVMRTLASRTRALHSARGSLLLLEALTLRFVGKEAHVRKVAAHARDEYARTCDAVYFASFSYSEFAQQHERSGAQGRATSLAELEDELMSRFINEFGDPRDRIAELIHRNYREILVGVWWRRHGPLGMVIVGTLSAFLVPLIAWNFQANAGFKQFILGWLSFLSEHFR